VADLLDEVLDGIGSRLANAARSLDDLAAIRSDVIVDAAFDALRALGREKRHEVAPLRRALGDVGFEIAWGRGLQPDYRGLVTSDPKDLFVLELAAEVSELGFLPGATPERIVEDVMLDLAKLIWARATTKALVFGAHRATGPASSLDELWTGFGAILGARDRESRWLLVALPNLGERSRALPGAEWKIVGRACDGTLGPVRERPLAAYFAG
jgi:hypothetical protein